MLAADPHRRAGRQNPPPLLQGDHTPAGARC